MKALIQSTYLIIGLVCLSGMQLVHAATPAEIDTMRNNSLAWLYLQQDSDGYWPSPGGTEIQATSLALLAFNQAGIQKGYSRGAALNWLSNAHANSTDSLALQVAALGQAGWDDTKPLVKLVNSKNYAVPGWGAYPNYQPTMIDTAKVLDAFFIRTALPGSTQELLDIFTYLVSILQNSDGGWSYTASTIGTTPVNGPSHLIPTAQGIIALSRWAPIVTTLDPFITNAVSWISSQQLTDGGFNDDSSSITGSAYETALVLQALRLAQAAGNTAANNATALITSAEDFLVINQNPNGSWSDDPFTSAQAVLGLSAVTLVDTDTDGIPDDVELIVGTNPTIADGRSLLDGIGESVLGTHTADQLVDVSFGTSVDVDLTSSQTATSFFFSVGRLPIGITLDETTGKLSGTSAESGLFNIEYIAVLIDGSQESRVVSLSIGEAPTVAIPMLPVVFSVLLACLLIFVANRHKQLSILIIFGSCLSFFVSGVHAEGYIPKYISDRIINEYTGGKTLDQTSVAIELEREILNMVKADKLGKTNEAKRMFLRSHKPKLSELKTKLRSQLNRREAKIHTRGNKLIAESVSRQNTELQSELEILLNDLDALGDPLRSGEAFTRIKNHLDNVQKNNLKHPDRPIINLKPIEIGSAKKLKASDSLPEYLITDMHERSKKMYAFNGDLLLLAAAPSTPTEAASCSYTTADLADDGKDVVLTQEIQNLAESLQYSPAKILEYVSNEIKFEPYFGALKGAQGTLESESGSATDQSSLLIALLRASNIPARYVRGTVAALNDVLPQQEEDTVIARWLKVKSYIAAFARLGSGKNPTATLITTNPNGVTFEHVWVEACVPYAHYRGSSIDNAGHRWVPMDASFESRRFSETVTTSEMFDFDQYLSGFNSRLPYEVYENQVQQSLTGNQSLKDIGYISEHEELELDILPISLPYNVVNFTNWSNSASPETAELPDTHRYFLELTTKNSSGAALGASASLRMSDILTKRVTLSFEGANTSAQTVLDDWRLNGGTLPTGISLVPAIHVNGTTVSTGTTAVLSETENNQLEMTVTLSEARSPLGSFCTSFPGTEIINAYCFETISAANYHALQAYAYQTSDRIMNALANGVIESVNGTSTLANDLDGTVGRFLHYAVLKYMGDISEHGKTLGQLQGTMGVSGLHLGLTSTQSHVEKLLDIPFGINKQGFVIDVSARYDANDLSTAQIDYENLLLFGYSGSAMETYIWQELARLDAVSTITGMQHANEVGSDVLTITPANQSTELPKLKTTSNDPTNPLAYPPSFVTDVIQTQYLNNNFDVTLPEEQIDYSGWEGFVLLVTKNIGTDIKASFQINGGFSGGYSVPNPTPITTFNPITNLGYVGGSFNTNVGLLPPVIPPIPPAITQINYGTIGNGINNNITYGGDPVNLVTGNFYHTEKDLVIPNRDLPLVFERSYNSRNPVDGPLGFGWTHSFNHSLKFLDEAPDNVEDSLDSDNVTSSIVWIDGSGGEKRITVTGSAGGVAIGSAMTPVEGFTFTITREANGTYHITEKDGLTYIFETDAGQVNNIAKLSQIVSRNNNNLTLTYNGNNLDRVTDQSSRFISFDYTSENRIQSLTDWTGRVQHYTYDANGNLQYYRNPLAIVGSQNPTEYKYYTSADSDVIDHSIKEIILPKGNSMTFEYYVDGRVFSHTNSKGEAITFQYNDFRRETIMTDARGFETRTFFNEFGNPIEVVDAEGAVTKYEYNDPQDPYNRTAVINAFSHRTEYQYDGLQNVTRITLPSSNTVEYSDFNVFSQPGKSKDANGNYHLFKYDPTGNVTDEIYLVAGVGASINPATYQPELNPNDVLAWTQHSYDSVGNKLTSKDVRDIVNIRGFERKWQFDTNQLYANQLEICGDKDGDGLVSDDACDVTPLTFDVLGRLTNGVNERFEPVSFDYDVLNRIKRGTDELGFQRDYGFDDNGNSDYERLSININGAPTLITSFAKEFDQADREVQIIDAAGFTTYADYDAMGNLIYVNNPDNYTVRFTHDGLGRVITAYDEEGREAKRNVDALGRIRSITDPNGNVQTVTYYGAAKDLRLEKECDALNRCATFDYDGNGNVTLLTDNAGQSTITQYDALNRPVRVVSPVYTDPVHGSVRPVSVYEYDKLGNLLSIDAGYTDSTGTNATSDVVIRQQTQTYDDWGRILTETDALSRQSSFAYNVNSDLIRLEDPKGQIIERDYTYGGLLEEQRSYESISDPSPHVITYQRNELGQVTNVTSPEVAYSYQYDVAHRLKRVTDSRGNAYLQYHWSPGGLLDTLEDSEGRLTDYLYDATGRLNTIWAPDNEVIGFRFDDGGRLTRKEMPGGVVSQYNYFTDDAINTITTTGSSGQIHNQSYTYDNLGRRQTMNETALGVLSRSETYGYDNLSRLLSVTAGTNVESWTYDEFGNRVTHTPNSGPVEHYIHNNNHQLTEIREGSVGGPLSHKFIYDLNSNLTKQCKTNVVDTGSNCTADDVLSLQYDALDRQKQASRTGVSTETYQYDPQGRRVVKTIGGVDTQYHYDGSAIYQNVVSDWTNPVARYVHGAGTDQPLLQYSASQTLAYHQDGNNSVIATTNAATGVNGSNQWFDAWGNQTFSSGLDIPTYGYTGREPDATGLIYYRARYYNPEVGRFTQRDPLGFIDGVNRYAYALNSPINFIDPTGTVSRSTNFILPDARARAKYYTAIGQSGFNRAPKSTATDFAIDVISVGLTVFDIINTPVSPGPDAVLLAGTLQGSKSGVKRSIRNNLGRQDIVHPNTSSVVRKYDVGTFDVLKARSVPGDKIDIHHVVQKHPAGKVIDNYDPLRAPAIAVPQREHRRIPTIKGEFTGSPRDLLAKDIKDLRNFTNTPNNALKYLINLNKKIFPDAFKK